MNSAKDIFIFIGPPGSGKGSLSQQCVKNFGWKQLSTGALCRKHINDQTEIGKAIDFAIKSGKLIADELVIAMVQEWLMQNVHFFNGFILDGFPRTITQACALNKLFSEKENDYKVNIVKLFISDETVVNRVTGRLVCKNSDCQTVYSNVCGELEPLNPMTCDNCMNLLIRRKDDEISTIQDRLKVYHMHEKQLLEFYEKNGFIIKSINVEKPLNQVFEDFQVLINKI